MKAFLRGTLALTLCLILSLLLIPGAFAEADQGSISVRFTNEKGYDLIGLHVFDADGNAVEPVETGSVYNYLLTPGEYTYAYLDERGVFLDLEDTSFTVADKALEIQITLTASFAENTVSVATVNPIYVDILDESDLAAPVLTQDEIIDQIVDELLPVYSDGSSLISQQEALFDSATEDDATEQLRAGMVNRQTAVQVSVFSTERWSGQQAAVEYQVLLDGALLHTGKQVEGDTLRFEYGGFHVNYTYNIGYGNVFRHDYIFTFTYYTTPAQESAVSNEVLNLVGRLGLNEKNEYEKILAIHQYLYQNVNYDYAHLNDSSYNLQYTSYAALIDKCAVCQGFAVAFYRLCLASGVDARVVDCNEMNHAWNIASLNGIFYEVDSTWDSNWREQGVSADLLPHFFLRGSDWWLDNHTLTVTINGQQRTVSGIGDQFIYGSNSYNPAFAYYTLSFVDYDASVFRIAINEANFPDPAFRAYVAANFDTSDSDGVLSDEEIAAVTFIDVSYNPNNASDPSDSVSLALDQASLFSASGERSAGIQESSQSLVLSDSAAFSASDDTDVCTDGPVKSLKGIEYFTALKTLICYGNQIEELDLSRNTELDTLACGLRLDGVRYGNKLSSLDLSHNKKLRIFACDGNLLKTLDLSANTDLEMLNCIGNELKSLIINKSPKLSWLYCWDNKLTSLDISENPNLEYLDCGINALTSLSVAANTKLKELSCYNNAIAQLIVAGNTALEYLDCTQNKLTTLDVCNHNALTELYCGRNYNLESLHLSGCGSLKYLYCFSNNLSRLDVTGCTALLTLDCSGNALQSLDISRNSMLQRLWCADNELSDLDVSQNSALLLLSCYNNSLSRLDVTGNTALRGLACHNNDLKALNISPCAVLTQLISDLTPEIQDGVVMYMDSTDNDAFRWLYFDEATLLITPDTAPGFVLPAALTRIEEDAFSGIQNLITVYIPNTVTYIDPNAFGEIGELYIFGQSGSAAETFAQSSSAYTFIPAA